MHPKSLAFLKEIEPVILKLASEWFPADKRTPDDKYFYACTYCDQGCGQHDTHHPDCLYELAKATKEVWDKIDGEVEKYKLNYAGEPRSIEDVVDIMEGIKYRAFFKHFFKFPTQFVAWDYSTAGKENNNVVCTCWMFEDKPKKLGKSTKHHKDCPEMKISQAIAKLYRLPD